MKNAKSILVLGAALVLAQSALATVNADSAVNYSGGWSNSANGGGGFGPWSITAIAGEGSASYGIWASADADLAMGNAFGFTAKGNGASIQLDRSFAQVMATGDVFTVDLGLNYDAGLGGNKGFVLRTSDNREIVTVNQANSDNITLNGVTALTNYGTTTMHWTFTQKTPTQILVYATGRSGSEAYAMILTNAQTSYLANIRFYATSITNDDNAALRGVYFNNLVLSQGAGTNTYSYTIETNRAIITGIATNATGAVVVPASLGGYPVTEVARSAFKDRTSITSISFESGASVTNIGPTAFQGCTGLMLAVLPTGLTALPAGLFYGCTGLVSVTIPSGVKVVGNTAFANCRNLTSLALPPGMTSVGESAFLNCRNLSSLELPSAIKSVPGQLCYEASAMRAITIPSGVTNIGYSAFYNCLQWTAPSLPSGLRTISHDAFSGCTGLGSLSIYSALSSVGDRAFFGCSGLQSLYFDGGVSSLGTGVFGYCPVLQAVYFACDVPSLGSGGGADMFAGDSNVSVHYLASPSNWGTSFCGMATAAWVPVLSAPLASGTSCTITVGWAEGRTVIAQACTNLASPVWDSVGTGIISGGVCTFTDPDAGANVRRYYRTVATQ